MTSNQVRIVSFILLLVTAILAAGDVTKIFPFLNPQYATLTTIIIVAIKEWAMSIVTPNTNAQAPDVLPPKPTQSTIPPSSP
jgi:hypothetical protein